MLSSSFKESTMKYTIRIDRLHIDDQALELYVGSKAEAAENVAMMIIMESVIEPNFEVLSHETTEDTLIVKTSTGTFQAYPKVDKSRMN